MQKDEFRILCIDRKMVTLEDGKYMFVVDAVYIGEGEYLCRGEDIDKSISTNWVNIKDDNPFHAFANYLKLEVDKKV